MRILFLLALAAISAASQTASTVRLTVADMHDFAVPRARVEVRPLRGGTPISRLTGEDGTVVLALDGPAEVHVRAEGFEPLFHRLETSVTTPLVLHLQPAVLRTTLNVTVRDDVAAPAATGHTLEIDRTAARTVLDGVDRLVPGAFVTRRGVMGYGIATNGTGGLSIRGVGESPNAGILMIVDGRPDFQGLMGHPLPDFYSLSDAGTVSVVEGPASVLYGSNAMGGIVEIKPWVPTEGMSTRLTTSLGSFYTGQHRFSHGAAFRRGYYSLNAGVAHTSGDRPSSAFRDQDGLTLEAGADFVNYGGAARNIKGRLNYGSHELTSAAGFARMQWSAISSVRLFAGGRYEHNSLFGGTGVPEVGAVWTPRRRVTVSAEAAKGYRNPTIRELYLFPAPNPNLKPEHMWNYQASIRVQPVDSLTATLTGFYADLSNLIVTTGRYPNVALQNTGAALNRGLEAAGRWRASRRIAIQSGYAWLRSTNLSPYVPAQKFNYGADINAGRAFVYFGGVVVGERWANTQHSAKLAGYHLGELRLTLPVKDHWRMFALVDNLFDRAYSVVPGYPMPGINATGGLSVSF